MTSKRISVAASRLAGVLAVLAVSAWLVPAANAEPMFLSKQYTRCTSCHISPTGGGLLSTYGRGLSAHELSLFRTPPPPEGTATPGEEAFLFGALGRSLGPLQLGIDMRPSHIETQVGNQSFPINMLMNADVIAAVQGHGWTAYGQVGREPGGKLISYEHWAGYEPQEGFGFRVGRFLPAYGVHFADHTMFSRSMLGFQEYDQVYGLELSRTSSHSLLQLTVSPGLAGTIVNNQPRQFNGSGRYQVDLGSTTAVVFSGLYRDRSALQPREAAGGMAFGFGVLKRVTVWTEGNVVGEGNSVGASFVFVNETSFEPFRGLWLRVSPQVRTQAGVQPQTMRWVFGATLLPRTHVNFDGSFYRDKPSLGVPVYTWLMTMHLYL